GVRNHRLDEVALYVRRAREEEAAATAAPVPAAAGAIRIAIDAVAAELQHLTRVVIDRGRVGAADGVVERVAFGVLRELIERVAREARVDAARRQPARPQQFGVELEQRRPQVRANQEVLRQ